ncbi:MAG: M23 family metallopeptidase, partial [Acidimicrobiia bacterium]
LKADLDEEKAELLLIRSDLTAQRNWLGERKALIESARAEKDAALKSVEQRIASEEAHVRSLEKESKALTAALQSSGSRSSGAVSSSGFIWPLRGRVTSEYGYRSGGFHPGIDIDGNTGDPIVASKAGTILGINCGSGYGTCTIIDHGGGVATLYAHMSRKAVSGGSVKQGQVIGYVGCTGSCSGDHLHFEVRVNGEPQNPRKFLP